MELAKRRLTTRNSRKHRLLRLPPRHARFRKTVQHQATLGGADSIHSPYGTAQRNGCRSFHGSSPPVSKARKSTPGSRQFNAAVRQNLSTLRGTFPLDAMLDSRAPLWNGSLVQGEACRPAWPTKTLSNLLRAGLTALTDHADPGLTWLPSGHARWRQPGVRPLLDEEWDALEGATEANHRDRIAELESETPLWSECDRSRRTELVAQWRKRWRWAASTEDLLERFGGATPPSQAPRMIGHRGSGKTSRPVLNLQST